MSHPSAQTLGTYRTGNALAVEIRPEWRNEPGEPMSNFGALDAPKRISAGSVHRFTYKNMNGTTEEFVLPTIQWRD